MIPIIRAAKSYQVGMANYHIYDETSDLRASTVHTSK